MYEDVIKEFDDIIKTDELFRSFSFNFAYSKLKKSKTHLKFLIGIPGSGKSFLIDYFYQNLEDTDKDKVIILKGAISKEELHKSLVTHTFIIIDEAQLLDIKMIEFIRTLSDSRTHSFLLSMHTNDAMEILKMEHFKSRNIDVIDLKPISKQEMIQYLNQKLLNTNANHLFTKKEFDIIFKYTKGNFRYIKKFVKTLFELLEFASNNNLKKYKDINSCLITMTAIELGLENG